MNYFKSLGVISMKQAPANYPEIAQYLVELGIDSISVNPSRILRTMEAVSAAEAAAEEKSVQLEPAE